MRLSSAPLPDFVEAVKAQLVDSIRPGDWICEIKFDGYRALALRGGLKLGSCHGTKGSWKEVPKIRDSIAALDVQDAIIDYAACGIIPFYAAPSTEFPLARVLSGAA